MARYLVKRALSGLLALFIFVTILFFVVQILTPGDFVSGLMLPPEEKEALRRELGLDLPLWQQYLLWLQSLFSGGLASMFAAPEPLIRTLLVFIAGMGLAFLFGMWLGKATAWRGSRLFSGAASFTAIAMYTTFPPWLGFLIVQFFMWRLGWFRNDLDLRLWSTSLVSREDVMFYLILSLIAAALVWTILNRLLRRWRRYRPVRLLPLPLLAVGMAASWSVLGFSPQAWDVLRVAGIPILTYALLVFGEITLVMQTSMRDTLNEDYIQTARAKGLPERIVRDRHAGRNALLPALSRLVISLPYMLTGLVIIEVTLLKVGHVNWFGMGSGLFYGLRDQNMPVVMQAFLQVGLVSLVARLVLDVLQAYLDPRIHLGAHPVERF